MKMIGDAQGPVKGKYPEISMIFEELNPALLRRGIDGQSAAVQVDWSRSLIDVLPSVPLWNRSAIAIDYFLAAIRENQKINTARAATRDVRDRANMQWAVRFQAFALSRDGDVPRTELVREFLEDLATAGMVAASTQN